jgi:membrane-bound lytic murein transglycosylase D
MKPKTEVVANEEQAVLDDESFDWDLKVPKNQDVVVLTTALTSTPYIETTVNPVQDTVATIPTVREPRPATHTVAPGDTYYSIAKKYDLEVSELLRINNLLVSSALHPGDILKVIDNEGIKAIEEGTPNFSVVTYEVKPSDTLYSIARLYGVTIKDLMDWNHKTDFTLTKGEKLEIRQNQR